MQLARGCDERWPWHSAIARGESSPQLGRWRALTSRAAPASPEPAANGARDLQARVALLVRVPVVCAGPRHASALAISRRCARRDMAHGGAPPSNSSTTFRPCGLRQLAHLQSGAHPICNAAGGECGCWATARRYGDAGKQNLSEPRP
jgi:hypothetical protein